MIIDYCIMNIHECATTSLIYPHDDNGQRRAKLEPLMQFFGKTLALVILVTHFNLLFDYFAAILSFHLANAPVRLA